MKGECVVFFGLAEDPYSEAALDHLRTLFSEVFPVMGKNTVGETSPGICIERDWDYVFTFKTRQILRAPFLARVRRAAVNFHTSLPRYPGSGGVSWALYNGDTEAGITVHHINEKVDNGPIITTRSFPISPSDTVSSLIAKTYEHQLSVFKKTAGLLHDQGMDGLARLQDAYAGEGWGPVTFRHRDLDRIKTVPLDADDLELQRRIRATSFGKYQPYILLHGRKFVLKP